MFGRAAIVSFAAAISIGCTAQGRFGNANVVATVSFDGGVEQVDMPPSLPGNSLPLDFGTGADGSSADGGAVALLGELVLDVRDSETKKPMPARVIFRPPPGRGFADDILHGDYFVGSPGAMTGAVVGPGVVGSPEGVLLQTGIGHVPVPPGTYDLFINRGPEWEAVETKVTVRAGESQRVNAVLERSVDTSGWIAADLHVHMASSFDSAVPADRRIISMASSGVELMVTTDHHHIVDALPMMRALGYGPSEMMTLSGDELNFNEGHAGVYPVPYRADQPYGGSPPYQRYNNRPDRCDQPWIGTNCYSDVDAFPLIHSLFPSAILTVNHPWWPTADLGYFTNIHWGAGTKRPLPNAMPTAGMFDALEILNGYWQRGDAFQALIQDWFYLLSQGYRVTALGSSDTHKINWVRAGFPRTWLRLPSDKPGDITPETFAAAVKQGRAVASTGPFVTMTADGGEIGDVVKPKHKGQVTVDVTADAPSWIHINTVQLFVDGVSKQKWEVASDQRPVFTATVTVPVTTDSWIVVVAGGRDPLPADVVGESSHYGGWEVTPFAITNPIYVDVDGNGWHPTKKWRGNPALDPHDYGWDQTVTPPKPPKPTPPPGKNKGPAAPADREHGPIPLDCDPGKEPGFETEPPLNAMQTVMPLLYP